MSNLLSGRCDNLSNVNRANSYSTNGKIFTTLSGCIEFEWLAVDAWLNCAKIQKRVEKLNFTDLTETFFFSKT